jgi:hypothetical protein
MARKISARHALDEDELKFCTVYAAFGETNAPEAYRRSHPQECFKWNTETGKWDKNEPLLTAKAVGQRAMRLLEQDYIVDFLKELKAPPGDSAREVFTEATLLGNDSGRLKAAEKVLDLESDLGFQDAVDRFFHIACAIGDEVVVPLPDGGEVSFPMREMFPRYDDPLPPAEVLYKTLQSLDQFLWVQIGKEAGEEKPRDARDWKYGDGARDYQRQLR